MFVFVCVCVCVHGCVYMIKSLADVFYLGLSEMIVPKKQYFPKDPYSKTEKEVYFQGLYERTHTYTDTYTHTHTLSHTYTQKHTHTHTHIYIYVCVCVCV